MANDFSVNQFKLKDPVRNIPDGLQDPVKDKTPGFFQSLRNPLDLMLEESLPASLYQWMTGNTKKKQAQEALDYIRNNPRDKGSRIYQEAERKLQRFGYLLDDGPLTFDFKEFSNMVKANPRLFGAELVNMVMADPYLLFMPLGWHRLGRGIVNSIRFKYGKNFKIVKDKESISRLGQLKRQARQDIKVGSVATLGLPLVFSTTWQLGEKAELDPKRTAVETTIGATAGAVFSVAFAGMHGVMSRTTGMPKAVVERIGNKVLNKYQKNPERAIDFTENGFYVINDDFLKTIQRETSYLNKANEFDEAARNIHLAMKPPVENARDMAKNTLLKMATFGGIGATAEFLTEPDDKLLASGKGFIAGSALYLGGKALSSLFGRQNKQWAAAEAKAEAAMSAPDYMTIRYNTAAQKVSNLWKDYLPDNFSRRKVGHYLMETKVDENLNFNPRAKPIQWNELTKEEKIFAKQVRIMFDDIGTTFQDSGLIFGKRSNYLPLLWQDYPGRDLFKFVSDFDKRVYGGSGKFPYATRSVFNDVNEGLQKGFKLKPGMDDPAELIRIYTLSASKALAQRNLIRHLRSQRIGNSKFRKGVPYIITEPSDIVGLTPKDLSNYVKMEPVHPAFKSKMPGFEPQVHRSIHSALKMVFDARTENELVQALNTTNFMMKRLAVGFSLFHAGALVESLWFSGARWNTIKKTIVPRSKEEVRDFFNNPNKYIQDDFPHAIDVLRANGYDDVIRFGQGHGLQVSIPEDAGNDIFYFNLAKGDIKIDDLMKRHFGIKSDKNLEKVFKQFDRYTWDNVFTKSKIFAFLTALNNKEVYMPGPGGRKWFKTNNPNKLEPGDNSETVYRKARGAAAYANDAFGGQNWPNVVSEIRTPWLKRLAQTTYNPGSRGYLQQFLFAPDWTTSNVRIIAKGMPGFESDPNKRRLYQYYSMRAALIFATAGSALNYMFSGHGILENTDPTRIDLGNGEVLTFSKQLMEPLHWITDPQATLTKKIGSLPRTSIEVLTNKQYLTTKWSPNITSKDDDAIEKAQKIGGHVGMRFLPIWLQSASRNVAEGLEREGLSADLAADTAVDFVLGQLGHPRYKGPRYTQYKTKGLVRSPYETLF